MLIVIPAISLPKIPIRLRHSDRWSSKHYNQQRPVKTFLEKINLYPMHYPGMFIFQNQKSFCCQSSLFIPNLLLKSLRQLFQIHFTLKELWMFPHSHRWPLHLIHWEGQGLSSSLYSLNFVCIIIHPLLSPHHPSFAFPPFILFLEKPHLISSWGSFTRDSLLPSPLSPFWYLQVLVLL